MSRICLSKPVADSFLRAIENGDLRPEELVSTATKKVSTEDRIKILSKFVGPSYAKEANLVFEKKILMKNTEKALKSWILDVGNLRPEVKRDLLTRIQRIDKVLTAQDEDDFLRDLVADKLGVRTSLEDATTISKLAKEFASAKANPNSGLKYGVAEVKLNNFINDLRLNAEGRTLKEIGKDIKNNPAREFYTGFEELAGAAKGMKAALDNSAIFRQGWKTMFTNPMIWANNAIKSFDDIWKQLGAPAKKGLFSGQNDTVIDATKAEIYSRVNNRNGLYKRLKLDLGNLEEAYPSSLPERIPLFGRLYKASEAAYTSFLYRMRADIADKLIAIAEKEGVDFTVPEQSEAIGTLINSLTGRGNLGALEKIAKPINTIFFSPKMLKGNIDFLTHPLGFDLAGKEVTRFTQKQAVFNILKVASGIATILGVAKALNPDSVELDSRSADFGKIRVGDTRFDVSGGMSPIIVLATRMIRQSSKSSTTGKVTKINEKNKDGTPKFGAKSGGDVFFDFFENKYSPAFSVLKQLRDNQTFEGTPPTAGSLIIDSTLPLTIDNVYGATQNDKAANMWLILMSESLGISTNTYSRRK